MTTYYVDPNLGSDSNDGLTTNTPFATVKAQSAYSPGNTWLIKRGTIHSPIDAAFTGNAANESARTIYGAYGSKSDAPPKIIANGSTYGIRIQNKDYVTVQDIDIYGATNTGLQAISNVTRACNYLRATRVRAYDCGFTGVGLTHAVSPSGLAPSAAKGVIFDSCEGHRNGQHGVAIVAFADTPILRNCYATNNSLSSSGWGVYHGGFSETYIGSAGWTIVGDVKSRVIATAAKPYGVVCGNTVGGTYFLTENVGTPTTPGVGEWGYSGTTVYVNIGVISSGYAITFNFQPSTNAIIEDCRGDNHRFFDAVGVGIDRGVYGGRIVRSGGYNNLGSAVQVNQATNINVHSIVSYGNREAVLMSSIGGNCTVNHVSSKDLMYGIRIERLYTGDTVTCNNNVLLAPTSFYAATINGTITADYNTYTGNLSGVAAGGNDSTDVSKINSDFVLDSTAHAVHSGLFLGYKQDFNGTQYNVPPSRGAFEYIRSRGVRT